MDERDQSSHSAGEHELASEVSERIRGIISSAEAAANAVRHEAEQRAQSRRRIAEEEAERIVRDARADADALVAERVRRISQLSDVIVERGEQIVTRLDRAEEVRRQLQTLADSLGETAELLASEIESETPVSEVSESPADAESDTTVARIVEPEPVEDEPAAEVEELVEAEPVEDEPVEEEPVEEEQETVEAENVEELDEPGSDVVDIVEQRRESLKGEEAEADDQREPDEQLSARLVALQMAVAGGNRGEVHEHLSRTFEVSDLESILDDVFGSGTQSDKRVVWPRSNDPAA